MKNNIKYKNKEVNSFISEAILNLTKSRININLSNKNTLHECDGYFDEQFKVFACAIGKPLKLWFPVFVHEYCHFLQSKEKIFKNSHKAYSSIWDWLDREIELPRNKVINYCKTIRNIEIDCDKRAVELIKQKKLPISIENYIRDANIYSLYYNILPYTRKWLTNFPYDDYIIKRNMPKYFLKNYDRTPKWYKERILKRSKK
jgi:hypothetical protein